MKKIIFSNIKLQSLQAKESVKFYEEEFGDLASYFRIFENDKEGSITKAIILNSKFIGFYSIWKNQTHPEFECFTIILNEEYQSIENYKIIFEEIKKNTENNNLQTAFLDNEKIKKDFLKSIGFQTVNICKTGLVDKDKINLLEDIKENKNYQIKSLDEVEISRLDFFNLLKEGYCKNHLYNPPVVLETKDNIDFYNEDLYKKGSFLIYENNKIVGFFITRDDGDGEVYLGDIYLKENISMEVLDICINNFIKILEKDDNFSKISYEIDSANIFATYVLSKLEIKNSDNFNICHILGQ
jgi:hypothetical protein